jgi:hypothetical protein
VPSDIPSEELQAHEIILERLVDDASFTRYHVVKGKFLPFDSAICPSLRVGLTYHSDASRTNGLNLEELTNRLRNPLRPSRRAGGLYIFIFETDNLRFVNIGVSGIRDPDAWSHSQPPVDTELEALVRKAVLARVLEQHRQARIAAPKKILLWGPVRNQAQLEGLIHTFLSPSRANIKFHDKDSYHGEYFNVDQEIAIPVIKFFYNLLKCDAYSQAGELHPVLNQLLSLVVSWPQHHEIIGLDISLSMQRLGRCLRLPGFVVPGTEFDARVDRVPEDDGTSPELSICAFFGPGQRSTH